MRKLKFNIPFIKFRWLFVSISVVFVIAGIIIIASKGFNYGIDFKGGVKLTYQFAAQVSEGEVRQTLAAADIQGADVVRYGEASENRMVVKVEMPEEHALLGEVITTALAKTFGEGAVTLQSEETVGPKVGQEMRKKAWLAVIFAVVLMLIYIGYRFDFYFAPGAVIALAHDVIITMAFFALFNKEFNISILAALLTIVGYSINDTIIVYDRIRENRGQINSQTIYEIVNRSINQTLGRTIITVLTVLFVLFAILFKGGGTLHDFAFAMIVGFVSGTYSSIFVASPCYIAMYKLVPKVKALLNR
ncbi:MAG: protein translocase subunit SecF [Pseudomonadota bacterium]